MADASVAPFSLSATTNGVMAPEGFRAAAVAAGIKKKGASRPDARINQAPLDLAVIAADRPIPTAALFTTNLAQAAPVLVSKRHLASTAGLARGIVVNAGCANACTGEAGLADATQ